MAKIHSQARAQANAAREAEALASRRSTLAVDWRKLREENIRRAKAAETKLAGPDRDWLMRACSSTPYAEVRS